MEKSTERRGERGRERRERESINKWKNVGWEAEEQGRIGGNMEEKYGERKEGKFERGERKESRGERIVISGRKGVARLDKRRRKRYEAKEGGKR